MDKPIKFSFHAEQRRKQRGLAERQIIEVIKRPDYFRKMPDGRVFAVKKVRNRTITVIYMEQDNLIRIITVF